MHEEANILMSSANIRKDNLSEELEMSLIYNKDSNGPNVLPWGIPHMTDCMDDIVSPRYVLFAAVFHPFVNDF